MAKRHRRRRLEMAVTAAAPDLIRFTGDGEALELLAESDRDGKKLRPFQMVAYTGGAMRVPGFYNPVVVDLAGLTVPSQRLPILRQHDPDRIVAHSESIDHTERRLKVAGVVSGIGPAAGEVVESAGNGFPWQASIGASVERKEFIDPGQTVKVNGRNFTGPVVVARAATLREISFVPIGADPHTSATFAGGTGGLDMNFADWCKARGINADSLTAEARAALEAAYKHDTANPPAPTPTPTPTPPGPGAAGGGGAGGANGRPVSARVETLRAREAAERHIDARLTDALEARRITSEEYDELRAAAFADPDRYDDNRLELEFIRRERPRGPGVSQTRDAPIGDDVVECAVAMAGNLGNIERHYPAAVCERARERWRAGLTLGELVFMVAQRNGWRGTSIRGNLKTVLQAATGYGPWGVRAASDPSTYNVPNILSNVAGKYALEGFWSVDQTWSKLAARRPVKDFKQILSLRLTGNLQFLRLPPGGEIKHGEIGEKTYANQAHTYARMIGISREDWINDDAGAFKTTSKELGIGGADAINNEFWSVFLNNGTFFTAGNNNISSGAFSAAGVAAADTVFHSQTKPNGRPLGAEPKYLLTSTKYRLDARTLMSSATIIGAPATPVPGGNALVGLYEPLSSPFLSNPAYTGWSVEAYYLLADPNVLPVIEGAFLDGVETPTIETADFDWNQLGTSLRGYLDFGFALQEYRGGVRSSGA